MKNLTVSILCLALLVQACNPVTGLPVEKALPNGVTTTYGYADLNRLTNITQQKGGTLLGAYAYTLDDAGNRKSVAELGGSSIQWSYDNLRRLTSETRKNGSSVAAESSFTYDLAGNRLTQSVNGVATNYAYNELDQLLTAGSIQYEYDGRGNLAKETNGSQITQYQYDAADRLTSVALPDSTNIANTYDADGRRVKQVTGSQVTSYLWDETSLYGDVVLETTSGINTSYTLAGTKLISQSRSGVESFYLQDGQGSTRTLTDDSGNVTDTYSYTAFGEIFSQSGTTENKYLYTGQQYDSSSGLYSLRARFYNPAVGRFLSQDTYSVNFNNPIELNRYGYTANNPINLIDPSGHDAAAERVGISVGTIALIGALMKGVGVAALFVVGVGVIYAICQLVNAPTRPQTIPQTKPITWQDILVLPVSQFDPTPQGTVFPPPWPSAEPWRTPVPTQLSTPQATPQGKTIVDLGSGTEGLWARQLKILHPDARVIATESGDNFRFLQMNLAGSGIEVINGWDNIPSGIADETWAIAPQTGIRQPTLRIPEGQAGLRITKLGGVFHMVVLYSEISRKSDLDAELLKISPTQQWNVQKIQLGMLGIPSQYYPSKADVWYITTIR